MFILVACMGQSPYSRSIWTGLCKGFERQGCVVQLVDSAQVPAPSNLQSLPDLFFAVHGGNVSVDTVSAYKTAGIPTAVYLLDEPYEVDSSVKWARYYDWVFTVDRATVGVHAQHSQCVHMSCGYDDTIFNTEGPSVESEILMLGSRFAARENILGRSILKFGQRFTWVGPGWNQLCTAGAHYNHLVSPEECAMFYRGANITLNIHRDSIWSHFGQLNKAEIKATHLNPRFWEAAACGSFAFSSTRSDLQKIAKGASSFDSEGELFNKLEYYINNPKARKKQAKLLQRAVKKHSYTERARQVLDLVIST
jgi:spore maturation protein CgeB